jgi:hypothetical protein
MQELFLFTQRTSREGFHERSKSGKPVQEIIKDLLINSWFGSLITKKASYY